VRWEDDSDTRINWKIKRKIRPPSIEGIYRGQINGFLKLFSKIWLFQVFLQQNSEKVNFGGNRVKTNKNRAIWYFFTHFLPFSQSFSGNCNSKNGKEHKK